MVLLLSLLQSTTSATALPTHAHHMNERLGSERPMAAALASPPGERVTSLRLPPLLDQ